MTRLTFTAIVAVAAISLTACGGGGSDGGLSNPPVLDTPRPSLPDPATAPALKTILAARYGVVNFPVGAAIEPHRPPARTPRC